MNIIAFTGAGISKSAGIPTFEKVPNLKEKLSVDFKEAHPKEFSEAMDNLVNAVKDKEPTQAHYALATLPIPIITMNIDGLHQKAGSRLVLEIHGNYKKDNIVLYGQDIHYIQEVVNLMLKTASEARFDEQKAIFLVIGTSMQTQFACTLAGMAERLGMDVHFINENADVEVPKFINERVFLPKGDKNG